MYLLLKRDHIVYQTRYGINEKGHHAFRRLIRILDHGGACNSCRSVNHTCSIDMTKRRQKPFYFVSEEEYRLLRRLCEQSFPDDDLSLENLRNLVAQGGNGSPTNGLSRPGGQITAADEIEPSETAVVDTPMETDDVPLPEIVGLHEDLGCLVADAQGVYRRVGLPRDFDVKI